MFMQFSPLKTDGPSVPISKAITSTAWASSLFFLTKSSLASMAHEEPSEVGLQRQHFVQ